MMLLEYLFKSAACMGAFLLFYQFLLEKENMHVFKRYFLLFSLIASLIIPAIVFTEYVEATPIASINQSTIDNSESIMPIANEKRVTDMDVVNWNLLFWSVYLLGILGFGFRFLKHLIQINLRIRKNPKLKQHSFTQVLLREKMPPHTFFKYIFLNKVAVEKKNIPEEVILHEETHAKQLHSIDVLFIELLQVLLWFNPLIYLFKKNIKLNHEFLADSAVLKENVPTKNYQNTLLSYLSKESNQKYQSVKMANAINYSSIKKRFSIMQKRTSKKSIVLRSLLLIPLLTLLLVGFSTKRELTIITDNVEEGIRYAARSLSIEILDDGSYLIEKSAANKSTFSKVINTFNRDITPEIRNNILNIHLSSSSEISNEEVWFVYNSFLEYGFYRIVAPNQEIIRPKGNKPFAIEEELSSSIGASKQELSEYNSLAERYNSVAIEKRIIPLSELKILETIYRKMSQTQKEKAQPFPECLPKNLQEGATREQMAEYNALAKKYYELPVGSNMSVDRKPSLNNELERVTYLYNLMSEKQKENAEPYPFLELKKYPQEGATREQMKTYNALARKYNEMDRDNMRISMKDMEQLKYIYGLMSDKQKADAEPFPDFPEPPPPPESPKVMKGEVSYIPPPPAPTEPLDHIIDMAKKGANFYYKGKKISSDRAIELLKKNKDLSISTSQKNNDPPTVKTLKVPIGTTHLKII